MIDIVTPSILFPAITLLLLAYTNRYLSLSQLIRTLHKDYKTSPSVKTLTQIKLLRNRVLLIRLMQILATSSIFSCTLSIFSLILDSYNLGFWLFCISMILFLGSILSSIIEISLSSKALNILLLDIESDS